MKNSYEIQNADQLLLPTTAAGYSPRVYKFRDLPDAEKPRERMLEQGVRSLSITELVAVLINTGTVREDVMTMASRIIREYGEKSFASFEDPKKLSDDIGIPIGKACQIVASSELGRRFYKKAGGRSVSIRNAKDVSLYVRDMHDLPKECLRGIYLNNYHKVIHDEMLSIGTIDANLVHPREVFKPAIEYGAAAVILVHNHPSGVALASKADIEITKQLVEAGRVLGISVIDHVIVGKGKFTSVPVPYE
jgi:DNA repair protein RadC